MISCKNLTFSYGYDPIFSDVSFSIGKKDKVGIVGPNGAGKSTLFKLLTKEEFPSDGILRMETSVVMVPQEVKYDVNLEKASSYLEYVDPSHSHPASSIHELFSGLGLDPNTLGNDLHSLSGGQKTKLALTRALLAQPEILLLDEPTNFLDSTGKKWVMHFLGAYKHTLLVVSHDLDLLDKHIKHVLFLNPHTHGIESFSGNYSKFVKTKQQQDALLTRAVVNEQKHIKRMEEGLVKLRKLTSKKGVHQRVMQERKIERIRDKLPELPKELSSFTMQFPFPSPIGAVTIRALNISKSFGERFVFKDLSIDLYKGERIALIGPNGVGKTTLIKILTGQLQPDSGLVTPSPSLSLGYYSQETEMLNDTQTLFEAVEGTHMVERDKVYGFLKKFLFSSERLKQKIGTLSGGEKTRLSIALLMTHPYNVLVLDEPTTYLDVMSQRIILEAIKAYRGTILLVSHTEQFVGELQPSRALLLPSQRLTHWTPQLLSQVSIIKA